MPKTRKKITYLIFALAICLYFNADSVKADSYEVSWANKSPYAQVGLKHWTALAASIDQTRLITAESIGRLYISTNAGENWNEIQPAGDFDKEWISLSMSDDGTKIFAAVKNGRLYSSADGGDNWSEEQPAGDVDKDWSFVSISPSGDLVTALVRNGRVYVGTFGKDGMDWIETQPAGDTDNNWKSASIGNDNQKLLLAAENGRLYYSNDAATNWVELQPAGDIDKNWSAVFINQSTLIASVNGGRIYFSINEGGSWDEFRPAGDVNKNWSSISSSENGQNIFSSVNGGRVYFSTNAGETWTETQPNGNSDQTWLFTHISDTTNVVTIDTEAGAFLGTLGLIAPSTPANFSTVANISNNSRFDDYPVFQSTELQKSATSIFSYAHGNVQIGNRFYIGTRTSPSKLVVFNDPNNLADYDSVTLAGINMLESLTYDSVNNRIYAVASNGAQDQNLKIYSFNPDNIHDYELVFNEASLPDNGSPSITTDGTYIYGVTYYFPPKIFKIRISDWSLVASRSWVGGPASGHAIKMHTYNDRTELYITAALGNSSVAKVNAADLSYVEYNFNATIALTDDIAFYYRDETGGTLYFGSESSNTIYALDTATMVVTSATAPATYGLFLNNNDLLVLSHLGYITKFIDRDFNSPRVYLFSNEIPNEFFSVEPGRLFFTNWSGPGYLKEYAETSTLATTSSLTISWEEDLAGAYFDVLISTNGVDYTPLELDDPYSTTITVNNLIPNTQYWFKVIANNGPSASEPAIYSLTTANFTPAAVPTIPVITSVSATTSGLTVSWTGNAPEYLIKISGTNSSWTTNQTQSFTGLQCGTQYSLYLKGRNINHVETAYNISSLSTVSCPAGGQNIQWDSSAFKNSNFNFTINNNASETDTQTLLLSFSANPRTTKGIAVSLDPNFKNTNLDNYSPQGQFILPTTPGRYTLYVKFFSFYGDVSPTISHSILLKTTFLSTSLPSKSSTPVTLPVFLFNRNLNPGMTHPDVKELQKFLNRYGFIVSKTGAGSPGKESSFFGAATKMALIRFQKSKKIFPTLGYFREISRKVVNSILLKK